MFLAVLSMSLAVLQANRVREDEMGLLFTTKDRKEPSDSYPWYQWQLPHLPLRRTAPPVLGRPPREWTWDTYILPVTLS